MRPRAAALRAIGHLSRRYDRPELLAAVDRGARGGFRDSLVGPAILAAVLDRNATFVDVGTNAGQWLGSATRCAPDGRHVGFEPIPALACFVRATYPTVDIRELALSDTPGESSFAYFRALSGFSGLQQRTDVSVEAEQLTVQVSTLDSELGDQRVDLVKIDVEGAELCVLRGGVEILDARRPLVIFEHQPGPAALYGATSSDVWGFFDALSYRIYTLDGAGPLTEAAFAARANAHAVNWIGRPG